MRNLAKMRRPAALIVLLLHATSSVLPAMAYHRQDVSEKSRYTIEVISASGETEERFAAKWQSELLSQINTMRSDERRIVLDSVKSALLESTETSRIGPRIVPGIIKVIDALSAETDSEYFARVRDLPTRVAVSQYTDEEGQQVVQKEFSINGVVRARTLQTIAQQVGTSAERLEGEYEDLSDADEFETATCSYTDDEMVTWTGECASQAEIDAGIATMIALENEVNTAISVTDAAVDDYCSYQIIPDPETCEPWEEPTEERAGDGYLSGPRASCYSQGIAYAGAVANWGFRLWKLSAALHAVNPPAGGVADALFLGTLGAAAVVGVGIALHECLQ